MKYKRLLQLQNEEGHIFFAVRACLPRELSQLVNMKSAGFLDGHPESSPFQSGFIPRHSSGFVNFSGCVSNLNQLGSDS